MIDPKPYDLRKQDEVDRLMRELRGYMRVTLNEGTDREGRFHAYQALCEIVDSGYDVSIDTEPFERPVMCRCGVNPAADPYSCPYAEEIGDNYDPEYCTCCDDCMKECAMDI